MMSSSPEQELEGLLADYKRQVAGFSETRRKLAEISVTETAIRQTVKATVGSQGELVDLQFPTGAYKKMAPLELSKIIIATVNKAREKVMAEVTAVLAPTLPTGFDPAALMDAGADLSDLLPAVPILSMTSSRTGDCPILSS
jgi:DNA-binding protein YbaB